MLVGRFVFRRRYHALEWLATLLLVGGRPATFGGPRGDALI